MTLPVWVQIVARGLRGDVSVFRHTYHPDRPAYAAIAAFAMQPSSGALPLMRTAAVAPKPVALIARRLLLRRYGCDVEVGAILAPGLLLAHATGIVIGGGVKLHPGVKLHQGVTLGISRGGCPTVESDAYIYAGAVVVGPVTVGAGARVGANSYVSADVPARATVPGGMRWSIADSDIEGASEPCG